MPAKKETAPATAPTVDDLFKSQPVAADRPTEAPPQPTPPAPSEERPTGESAGAPEQATASPQAQPVSPNAPRPGPARAPLPFYPTNTEEMWRYAVMLAQSKLLPSGFYPRGDYGKEQCRVADVHVVLMKGHDLGLKPMQAIGAINVIDGKAEIGALLMLSLVRKSGLCKSWRLLESTDRKAVFETQRVGEDFTTVFEYTIEEAEQMGLLDKGRDEAAKARNQWRLQPRTMLRRRCQTSLLREVYPDVVLGLYDHDELNEMRERADALGLREDQVSGAIDTTGVQASLPEPTEGAIKRLTREVKDASVDPLKARMAAKVAGSRVRRCSDCDSVLDPRDQDPCIACRPTPVLIPEGQ